VKGSTVTISPI